LLSEDHSERSGANEDKSQLESECVWFAHAAGDQSVLYDLRGIIGIEAPELISWHGDVRPT
jgi:hypothetical protein